MDWNLWEPLLSGVGGGGAALFAACILLKKNLSDLSARIERNERIQRECRKECDARLEKEDLEYRQIIAALNEIKVQNARNETLLNVRAELIRDFAREIAMEQTRGPAQ